MTSKSVAVSLSKQLYPIHLICVSAIGIILSTYTTDNLFEIAFGRTYAIKLIPEFAVL